MEIPGAPSVHAASLFMRVRTLTDIVGLPSFSSPSFSSAKDNRYLTILSNSNGFPSSTQRSEAQFHITLASLCQSSTYGDAWATPLEFWSKDVHYGLGGDYGISSGRLIRLAHQIGSYFHVYFFHLNRFRTARFGRTGADSGTDYAPLHVINLHGSLFRPRVLCDDEHITSWAVCYMFISRR
ncbi:hypothetical protein BS47DRAFT_1394857 [Hydnum rufescens UP504]|uniref:Uncharacterized protein n=1 Tax=Hydnum rufescens UP504 TaxID=1448309 RepID=A0A9P6DR36_9AGAM|nr:hypothetical protein BS47DRAFT_1394857 [Hydnum rufescens UP504]